MDKTKLKRVLATIAESEMQRMRTTIKSDLGFKAFHVEVFNTPDSHAEYEQAELRDPPDGPPEELDPLPWSSRAPKEKREAALASCNHPLEFFKKVICKSKEECEKETLFPQKSVGWLNARSSAITGSDFSSVVCRNPYKSSKKFLAEKVGKPHDHKEDKFSKKFMQWGVDHEIHADEAFRESVLNVFCMSPYLIEYPAMFKHVDAQWIAASPDGVLTYHDEDGAIRVELLEYKAPAYARHSSTYPYEKHEGGIPPQYYDQVQGTMWLMRNYDVYPNGRSVQGTYFVVWQPHALSVVYIPYAEEYATHLTSSVKKFYLESFLPECINELKRSV
jgi:putative phage-type endonuclease